MHMMYFICNFERNWLISIVRSLTSKLVEWHNFSELLYVCVCL